MLQPAQAVMAQVLRHPICLPILGCVWPLYSMVSPPGLLTTASKLYRKAALNERSIFYRKQCLISVTEDSMHKNVYCML